MPIDISDEWWAALALRPTRLSWAEFPMGIR